MQPRRRARGDRDRDHRQDRGGGQHHQRHRRAALDLVRGHLAGHRHVRAREGRRRRRAGSARQGQRRARRRCPKTIEQPRVDKLDPDAAPVLSARAQRASGRSATSPSSPTRCCAASSRAVERRRPGARSSAAGSGRSTSGSTPTRLRALQPDGHRRRSARSQRAERRDPRRPHRSGTRSRVDAARRAAASQTVARVRRRSSSARSGGHPVRDRATSRSVEDGEDDAETRRQRRRQPAPCCCNVRKQSGTNTVEVVDARQGAARRASAERCRRATRCASSATTSRVHRGVDPTTSKEHLVARRDPRGARRAALPRQPALHAHRGARDPDVDHRDVRPDVVHGLHAQHR